MPRIARPRPHSARGLVRHVRSVAQLGHLRAGRCGTSAGTGSAVPLAPSTATLPDSCSAARSLAARAVSRDTVSSAPSTSGDAATHVALVEHLERLLILRRFYRNCVRAEAYYRSSAAAYVPCSEEELAEMVSDEDRTAAVDARKNEAIVVLVDMQVVNEQLKMDLEQLEPCAAELLEAPPRSGPREAASVLRSLGTQCGKHVAARVEEEIHSLVSRGGTRSAKKVRKHVMKRASRLATGLSFAGAQRASSRFLAGNDTRPAVRRAQEAVAERGVREALQTSRTYVTGLWARLNGQQPPGQSALPFGMLPPVSNAEACRQHVEEVQLRVTQLEKSLREASKAREQRLRRAPIDARAMMAFEMQDMDQEVLALGRELALCTLDVQLDYLYVALEDELRQVLDAAVPAGLGRGEAAWAAVAGQTGLKKLAPRRGSTEELSVLLAQYALLARRQAALRDVMQRQEKVSVLMPAFDNELRALAEEIADARLRLGVPDQAVFGGSGFSLRKVQLQARENVATLKEGIDFFALGLRVLGSDVGYAGSLFGRASLGNTLKPREVSALRRTIKDLLTVVPFAIILIIPLTPLGHVLVFGFIQRYFPDFFPSQFNARRQEMVKRYEQLRQQLVAAQAAADHADDEQQLQQAAAAVARLAPPVPPAFLDSDGLAVPTGFGEVRGNAAATSDAPVHETVRDLEKAVAEAGRDALAFDSDAEDVDGAPAPPQRAAGGLLSETGGFAGLPGLDLRKRLRVMTGGGGAGDSKGGGAKEDAKKARDE